MKKNLKDIGKKDLKEYINKNGGYLPASIELVQNKFPAAAETKLRERFKGDENRINDILENAVYVKGISSNGDLNRNGYIIRASAWKPAIEGYMENPVFLLQHETEEIIGEAFTAKVTKNGLETESFIFPDQMSEANQKRFERGQLKGISTGHITNGIEWENEETGEVKTTEQWQELSWEERFFGPWLMAVTALEWVEQSLVTIPSNRKSMVTKKNRKLDYCMNALGENVPQEIIDRLSAEGPTKKELEQIDETVEEEKPADGDDLMKEVEEAAHEAVDENDTTPEEETVETETPETTETTADNVDEENEETEVVEETTPEVEPAENAVEGEKPESEETTENVEETETTEEPKPEEKSEVEENKPERPALAETLQKFRNGMTAKITNHNEPENGEEAETPEEEVEEVEEKEEPKVEENKAKAEEPRKLEIRTDSLENMVSDLHENGLGAVADKFTAELNAITAQKNEIEVERDAFKKVVKNTPMRRKLSTVGQPGITTPKTSLDGTVIGDDKDKTNSNTLENALDDKGVVINYSSKGAGKITTHKPQ